MRFVAPLTGMAASAAQSNDDAAISRGAPGSMAKGTTVTVADALCVAASERRKLHTAASSRSAPLPEASHRTTRREDGGSDAARGLARTGAEAYQRPSALENDTSATSSGSRSMVMVPSSRAFAACSDQLSPLRARG